MDLDEDELRATRKMYGLDEGMSEEITRKDYVLTNINPNGYYVIRLKDDKEYVVWHRRKPKNEYFIKKDNKEIPLDKEIEQAYKSSVREYETYGI